MSTIKIKAPVRIIVAPGFRYIQRHLSRQVVRQDTFMEAGVTNVPPMPSAKQAGGWTNRRTGVWAHGTHARTPRTPCTHPTHTPHARMHATHPTHAHTHARHARTHAQELSRDMLRGESASELHRETDCDVAAVLGDVACPTSGQGPAHIESGTGPHRVMTEPRPSPGGHRTSDRRAHERGQTQSRPSHTMLWPPRPSGYTRGHRHNAKGPFGWEILLSPTT